MTPKRLTTEEAILSRAKHKEYQREYHAGLDIDIKRHYMKSRDRIKLYEAQKRYRIKKKLSK